MDLCVLTDSDHFVQTRTCVSRHGPLVRLAQLVERKALNLVVVGSSPTVGRYSFSPEMRHLGSVFGVLVAARPGDGEV